MKLKIFTLTFSDSKNGFDDHAIQDFQSDREIIEVTEHFFVHEQTPYLTVLLSYRDIAADEKRKPATKRRFDPRDDLDEAEKAVYDALRSWRAARAKQEGFRDRVVHHAVCKVLGPIFERSFIFDSYACRKGKGAQAAIKRAQGYMRRFPYYLKLDIRKYFDSVDHEMLKRLLHRRIKDRDLLWLLDVIIDHPVPWTAPGKGIPIGNLTSQHFANFYLDQVDHFIKDEIGLKGYVRYMDDLLLFSNDKPELWDAFSQVERFLDERLALTVKIGSVVLSPTHEGLSFLGLRVYPGLIRLSRKGWRRFRRNVIQKEKLYEQGFVSADELNRSIGSVVGHIRHADTRNLRAVFLKTMRGLTCKRLQSAIENRQSAFDWARALEARTASNVAAIGTTTRRTAGLRTVTTTRPATATTTSARAFPVHGIARCDAFTDSSPAHTLTIGPGPVPVGISHRTNMPTPAAASRRLATTVRTWPSG